MTRVLFRKMVEAARTPRDGEVTEVEGWPVRFLVNPRARRISVRIDSRRREAVATAPRAADLSTALAFVHARGPWIAEHLARVPGKTPLRPGMVIEASGAPLRLERAAMRITPRLIPASASEPARLIASGQDEAYGRAVIRALKAEALQRLTQRTEVHAAALGKPTPSIGVADPKARWGSCKAPPRGQAVIRYSWRLVLAPEWVLDYVAAHEAAHLVEQNHSPAFWSLVDQLFGDHRPARRWLAANGAALHAYSA